MSSVDLTDNASTQTQENERPLTPLTPIGSEGYRTPPRENPSVTEPIQGHDPEFGQANTTQAGALNSSPAKGKLTNEFAAAKQNAEDLKHRNRANMSKRFVKMTTADFMREFMSENQSNTDGADGSEHQSEPDLLQTFNSVNTAQTEKELQKSFVGSSLRLKYLILMVG